MDSQTELPSIFYQNLATPQPRDGRAQQPQYSLHQSHHQGQVNYPILPRTPPAPNYPQASFRGQRPSTYSQYSGSTAVQSQTAIQPASTDSLMPIPRAAKTVNECLALETRYPELDNILTRK